MDIGPELRVIQVEENQIPVPPSPGLERSGPETPGEDQSPVEEAAALSHIA